MKIKKISSTSLIQLVLDTLFLWDREQRAQVAEEILGKTKEFTENDLAEVLSMWDEEDLASKAEEVLGHTVKYKGKDVYEIKE